MDPNFQVIVKKANLTGMEFANFDGSPITIESAQVSRSSQLGRAFLQLSVRNVSALVVDRVLLAATITCEDGSALVVEIQQLDFKVPPKGVAEIRPTELESIFITTFDVQIMKVWYATGEVWEAASQVVLPKPERISMPPEKIDEYKRALVDLSLPNGNYSYVFKQFEKSWQCVCGQVNCGTDDCSRCGLKRTFARCVQTDEYLEQHRTKRLELEAIIAERAAEQVRQVEANASARKATLKKVKIALAIGATILVLAGLAVGFFKGKEYIKERRAEKAQIEKQERAAEMAANYCTKYGVEVDDEESAIAFARLIIRENNLDGIDDAIEVLQPYSSNSEVDYLINYLKAMANPQSGSSFTGE